MLAGNISFGELKAVTVALCGVPKDYIDADALLVQLSVNPGFWTSLQGEQITGPYAYDGFEFMLTSPIRDTGDVSAAFFAIKTELSQNLRSIESAV